MVLYSDSLNQELNSKMRVKQILQHNALDATTYKVKRVYTRLRQLLEPKYVHLSAPDYFEDSTDILLSTARGRDSIALRLARGGWDGFEAPVPNVVAACAQYTEGAFFDVGANTGLYSLLVAKASLNTSVHAFEPYTPARENLLANIRCNSLASRIDVVEFALSDKKGVQALYIPLQNHGSIESSSSLNPDFKPEHAQAIQVNVSTLDDYVEENEINRLGLLKIDVESTEHLVIAGADDTIKRDRPLIVVEVLHLANHQWLNQFCLDNTYRAFTLHIDSICGRDFVAFDNTAWNQCLCPQENTSILQRCAQTIGLEFSL